MLKLTYSNLEFQNFPGEDPDLQGEEIEGEGRGKGREGGRGREGGTGRDRGGKEGGREERNGGWWGGEWGARHGLRPLETSSGSAPVSQQVAARYGSNPGE